MTSETAPRIFLADEEYVLNSMLADLLRAEGWDAQAFRDPFEALAAAHVAPPDVLVCDVEIPPLHGLELAERMRRQSPDCKVLLLYPLGRQSPARLDPFSGQGLHPCLRPGASQRAA